MANNKFFTFISLNDAADGSKNVTTIVTLNKQDVKDVGDGKKVFRCTAPISNRVKTLNNALNINLPEEETTWVDVLFWNERAERAEKFFGDRTKVRVVICGKMTARNWTAQDGSARTRVQIAVNDWTIFPTTEKKVEEEELY